ncbi:hypothetical protein L873DRAFT_1907234 [Choiromyces venosus 120613-1]|uniref:Uncharacterized protein n=1 Tax=Choiromyces venosus 120613-1 TaxID=1336337 RepID=A0A3N4JMD2_9PEZI|nr:hypothetical protein L873DRAFT_1907234 [Choiromyces venosus 120613-1]
MPISQSFSIQSLSFFINNSRIYCTGIEDYETIKSFAQSIERVEGPRRIWEFVDGTLHPICRLEDDQNQFT